MGMLLIGVHLIGMCLMGMHLVGMCLMGVYFIPSAAQRVIQLAPWHAGKGR
jgi:hypothetical protein